MESETGAVDAAGEAVGLLSRFPSSVLERLGRIISRAFAVGLFFFVLRSRRDVFALVVVDITAKFEVEICLGGRSS